MNERRKPGDYEVGYGKPPIEHRFNKGKSGNPDGGRKHKRRPAEIEIERTKLAFAKVAAKELSLGDGTKITTIEAIARKITKLALDGDVRAAKLIIEYQTANEADVYKLHLDNYESILLYKQTVRADGPSLSRTNWPQHDPRDYEVDHLTGQVRFCGPRTERGAAVYAKVADYRDDLIREAKEFRNMTGGIGSAPEIHRLRLISELNERLPPSYRSSPPSPDASDDATTTSQPEAPARGGGRERRGTA